MWILKGSLLGTGLFLVGTVLFLIATTGPFRANKAIGLNVITGLTIHNLLFWVAFVASLMIGCAIVGSWPVAAKM
jgi:hypothetical protein